MEHNALRSVNNGLNTNIYSYLETSGGQSSNLYLNVVHFFQHVLIRYLWQHKLVVFLHWCLICAVIFCVLNVCAFTLLLNVIMSSVILPNVVVPTESLTKQTRVK
jgi:hypothetical protein